MVEKLFLLRLRDRESYLKDPEKSYALNCESYMKDLERVMLKVKLEATKVTRKIWKRIAMIVLHGEIAKVT